MKKYLWYTLSLMLCLSLTSPAAAIVWELGAGGNGHRYEIFYFDHGTNKSWESASSALAGTGYTLATITSLEEQAFIQTFLNAYAERGKKDLWIGGFQDPAEADPNAGWSWVTGEAWDYTSWASGEANDYYDVRWGTLNSERYLSVRSGYNWNWNDEGNLGNISGYLAEAAAPVPEPGTIVLMGLGLVGLAGLGRKRFMK